MRVVAVHKNGALIMILLQSSGRRPQGTLIVGHLMRAGCGVLSPPCSSFRHLRTLSF